MPRADGESSGLSEPLNGAGSGSGSGPDVERPPPTWADYRRIATNPQLLPVYAASFIFRTITYVDDNLSLLLSQAVCVEEERVPPALCQQQNALVESATYHDAALRISERATDLTSFGQAGNQLCMMSTMLLLGAASDRISRKFVLQVALLSCILDYLAVATVDDLGLLVGLHASCGALGGAGNGMFTTVITMLATDLTDAKDRMLTVTMTQGMYFLTLVSGPFFAGTIVHLLNTEARGYLAALRLSFGVGSASMVGLLVLVQLVIVEPEKEEETAVPPGAEGVETSCRGIVGDVAKKGNPKSMWLLLKETREGSADRAGSPIATLVTLIFMVNHFASGASVLVPLYAEHLFGWEATTLGYFESVGGVLNIMASFVVLPTLVICWGERRAAITMMCCGLSGFLLMGVSGLTAESAVSGSDADGEEMAGWFRIGCMVLGYPLRSTQQLAFRAFSIQCLKRRRADMWFNVGTVYYAIGTQSVKKSQVARLLTTWQFLNTLALMLSPLMFRWIWAHSVSWMPGLMWFVESGLFLIGFAFFFSLPDWTKDASEAPTRGRGLTMEQEEQDLLEKARFALAEYGADDARYQEVARRLAAVQEQRAQGELTRESTNDAMARAQAASMSGPAAPDAPRGASVADVFESGPSLQ